jgi:mitofusin
MVIVLLLFLERMSGLLPAEKKQVSLNILPRREPFEILYRLNCDNLCADFHEELDFRFSWGLTSIISRFAGKRANSLALTNYSQRVSMICIIVSITGIGLV